MSTGLFPLSKNYNTVPVTTRDTSRETESPKALACSKERQAFRYPLVRQPTCEHKYAKRITLRYTSRPESQQPLASEFPSTVPAAGGPSKPQAKSSRQLNGILGRHMKALFVCTESLKACVLGMMG